MSKRFLIVALVLAGFIGGCADVSTAPRVTERHAPEAGSMNTATDSTGRGTNTFGSGN